LVFFVVKKATVIIPTRDRSENIGEWVRQTRAALPEADILVMDNSTDKRGVPGAREAGCRVVQSTSRGGAAKAVIEGISLSQDCDSIVVTDGEPQYSAADLPKIMSKLEGNDLVVSSRWVAGVDPHGGNSTGTVVARLANLLAWPLAPRIKDRISGFLAFRRAVVDAGSLDPNAWNIGLEIMARGRYASVAEVPLAASGKSENRMSAGHLLGYVRQLVSLYMSKFQVLNFMVVGGIGYVINMGAYSVLLRVFKGAETTFLGQHFYLPPFVFSSLLAIVSNYELNRVWTFKGWTEQSVGFVRYLSMALVTLLFDMAALWALVDFGKLTPILAAALAIAIVFIIRYFIAKRWIWSRKSPSP